MFGNTRQLEKQIADQKVMIETLISEVRALQTHIRFIMDDTDAIANDLRSLKGALPELMEIQPRSTGNWKVERL